MKNIDEMINTIITTYISIMGAEKWNSLDAQQQHDAIMIIARDMIRALD